MVFWACGLGFEVCRFLVSDGARLGKGGGEGGGSGKGWVKRWGVIVNCGFYVKGRRFRKKVRGSVGLSFGGILSGQERWGGRTVRLCLANWLLV